MSPAIARDAEAALAVVYEHQQAGCVDSAELDAAALYLEYLAAEGHGEELAEMWEAFDTTTEVM